MNRCVALIPRVMALPLDLVFLGLGVLGLWLCVGTRSATAQGHRYGNTDHDDGDDGDEDEMLDVGDPFVVGGDRTEETREASDPRAQTMISEGHRIITHFDYVLAPLAMN